MEVSLGRAIALIIVFLAIVISYAEIVKNMKERGLVQQGDPQVEGLEKGVIKLDNKQQPFYLYTNNQKADERRPAILVLQGSGVSAVNMREAGFDDLADRENLSIIYVPLSTPSWLLNAAIEGENTSAAFDVDTVNFVHQMLEELIVNVRLDPSRIFLTGFSDGGVATFYFMCELSHLVAAVATVSASMPVELIEDCSPERPIPLLMLNGTADKRVRFSGGIFGDPNRPQGLEMASAFDTATFWREANNCKQEDEKAVLDDVAPDDQVRVWTQIWKDCPDGAVIQFVTLLGGVHGWPGADLPMPTKQDPDMVLPKATSDIDGAEFIWSFFEGKALPPSQPDLPADSATP